MNQEEIDEILAHAGVKGMKWGKRKSRTIVKEAKVVGRIKKKSSKELTNQQLERSIKRMRLEKQYNELNPKGLNKGMKIAGVVVAVGTTITTIYNFSNSTLGQKIKEGVQSALNKNN